MQSPSQHPREDERLNVLAQLGLLDTQPEERFDRITKAATEQLHVPISTISLVDRDREWYKSCQGLKTKQGGRDVSFCGHAMLSKEIFIVGDTLKDPRFADNPSVVGSPYIRFYAGVALRHKPSGLPVGVLCIKDIKPREFSAQEMGILLDLARQAEQEINIRPEQ